MRSCFKVRIAILLIFICMLFTTALGEEGSKGILYKTQNDNITVYLLGSIHVGSREMHPFGETLLQAMNSADIFVFECDTESKEALATTVEMMYYKDSAVLADAIPEALYQKLKDACKKLKLRMSTFEKMKPWGVMSQISMYATAAEMGLKDVREAVSLGVEKTVYEFAKKNQKVFDYLETTQGQMEAFEGMSSSLQAFLLDESLTGILHPEQIKGMDATIRDWPRWWREGRLSAFVESYLDYYLSENPDETTAALFQEYHQQMITKRNQTMADKVATYLQGTEPHTYFVTVGLLHLGLPDDSVIRHLQEQGYTVEVISAF